MCCRARRLAKNDAQWASQARHPAGRRGCLHPKRLRACISTYSCGDVHRGGRSAEMHRTHGVRRTAASVHGPWVCRFRCDPSPRTDLAHRIAPCGPPAIVQAPLRLASAGLGCSTARRGTLLARLLGLLSRASDSQSSRWLRTMPADLTEHTKKITDGRAKR